MSDFVRLHRQEPTRLPRPWDSPGKNTGVGCHFLLQCIKVESESEVAQSCPTLSDSMDCSLPGSSAQPMLFSRQEYWSGVPLPSPTIYDKLCQKGKSLIHVKGLAEYNSLVALLFLLAQNFLLVPKSLDIYLETK